MTNATSVAARWHNSPRVYDVDHTRGDDAVWKVDGVYVSVHGDKLTVEAVNRSLSPQMRIEVYDGELRLPLEDLVPQVLERLDVSELAQMLCADEDARRAILDALARRYNEMSIEDADRRHWIAKVQSAIHDVKLDALTYSMTRIEQAVAQMGYRAMGDIHYDNVLRHELERAGLDTEAALERSRLFRPKQELVDFRPYLANSSVESAWQDARDFWRKQLIALFPTVVAEPSEAAQVDS